ncbi:uncharacterized protein LOC120804124 isoform X2 [Xiphias gladius]|uniref:uncharacterized protein LOC120804124 isoform X2 n=1 Tax=Xiphias gladius TaxID=8245 RepID=UPI001A98C87F|nr:uncharacterized protein LOC120804124 isoform X2 [Xiphias gladius]
METKMEREEEDGMEQHVVEIYKTDSMKHFTETRTRAALGPGPHTESDPGHGPHTDSDLSTGPGPEASVSTDFSHVDQILLTINTDVLLTVSTEEEGKGERKDDDDGLKNFQMKPHQDLKNSCGVFLERHRRKRITQSCSRLRQLLPTIHGCRTDMVTVLDTTVAFLEVVQKLVPAENPKLQSQATREVGQKMVAKQEKKKELNRLKMSECPSRVDGSQCRGRGGQAGDRQADRQSDRCL